MACDDRQLTQAQLEAGFQQQRTGVVQALRPFSGPATLDNLVDYLNRELGPAVRNARAKVNDCWQQVVDNAPSANPLGYYFSTNTANADPTAGRVRLDAATQNTATTLRVSESNARLQDVSPWLDMMIGGSTIPLGVVTLLDAINPGRYLRGNLTNITPQVGYRDLAITVFESSHADPFVDGEAVLISYIAGMADGGVTVPASVLAPIARDTFLGNIGTTTVAPSAVPLANVDSASIVYDGTSHTFQRAALTGFATATANGNATASAEPLVSYSSSSNMSAERVTTSSTSVTVDLGTASQVLFKRAALTGDVTAGADSNATTLANSAVTNAKLANISPGRVKGLQIDAAAPAAPVDLTGAEVGELVRVTHLDDGVGAAGTNNDFAIDVRQGIIRVNPGSLGGDVTFTGFALNGGGSTNNAGGRFVLVKQGASNKITLKNATGSSANNQLILPAARDIDITTENTAVAFAYWGSRWQMLGAPFAFAGTGIALSTTYVLSVDQSFSPTWTNAHVFSAPIISNLELLVNGSFLQNGVIAPSFGTTQDNWNPTGLSSACSVIRATATAGSLRITGIAAQGDGTRILLINVGTNAFTIDNESASSTAANRIKHNVDTFVIPLNDAVELWYDGTSARWRCIHQTTST